MTLSLHWKGIRNQIKLLYWSMVIWLVKSFSNCAHHLKAKFYSVGTQTQYIQWKSIKTDDLICRNSFFTAHTYILWFCICRKISGEGNGTPLQYACLENPMDRGVWWAAVHGVAKSWTRLSDLTFTFHFPALEKEMATHSSVLAWRIPGMGEPGGLPSMGSHRVRHDWSDLAAAAAGRLELSIYSGKNRDTQENNVERKSHYS